MKTVLFYTRTLNTTFFSLTYFGVGCCCSRERRVVERRGATDELGWANAKARARNLKRLITMILAVQRTLNSSTAKPSILSAHPTRANAKTVMYCVGCVVVRKDLTIWKLYCLYSTFRPIVQFANHKRSTWAIVDCGKVECWWGVYIKAVSRFGCKYLWLDQNENLRSVPYQELPGRDFQKEYTHQYWWPAKSEIRGSCISGTLVHILVCIHVFVPRFIPSTRFGESADNQRRA